MDWLLNIATTLFMEVRRARNRRRHAWDPETLAGQLTYADPLGIFMDFDSDSRYAALAAAMVQRFPSPRDAAGTDFEIAVERAIADCALLPVSPSHDQVDRTVRVFRRAARRSALVELA